MSHPHPREEESKKTKRQKRSVNKTGLVLSGKQTFASETYREHRCASQNRGRGLIPETLVPVRSSYSVKNLLSELFAVTCSVEKLRSSES